MGAPQRGFCGKAGAYRKTTGGVFTPPGLVFKLRPIILTKRPWKEGGALPASLFSSAAFHTQRGATLPSLSLTASRGRHAITLWEVEVITAKLPQLCLLKIAALRESFAKCI